MKKSIFLFFVLFTITLPIFAISEQHLFDYDSTESVLTRFLCNASGTTGPSSSYPLTAKEIEFALKRIDDTKLTDTLYNLYKDLIITIDEQNDTFSFIPNITINPQVFLTDGWANKEEIGGRNSFFLPYNKELPGISARMQATFGNVAYIEGETILKNNPLKDGIPLTSFDWLINHRNNQWNFMGSNQTGLVGEIPFLARGSFGNSWLNIIIGRTPHRMGNAYTGNLLINDNFDYQELIKLSLHSNYFTYEISATHFDRQINKNEFAKPSFSDKQQTRVVHRFAFNVLNKINIAFNLGTLYYCDAAFDFRWFNPLMIAHNYYNYSEDKILTNGDEANNTNSFEIEWTIGNGWTLGAQFILDQFQTFFENQDSLPSAYGILVNTSWNGILNNNLLTAWAEIAYINPYLYINDKYEATEHLIPNYNYDYYLGYHRRDWAVSSIAPSGYPYGPNTIVSAIGIIGKDLNHSIDYKATLQYRIKGASIDTLGSNDIKTPYGNLNHILQISGHVNWMILTNLNIISGASITQMWNPVNDKDYKYTIRPEAYMGFTWSII